MIFGDSNAVQGVCFVAYEKGKYLWMPHPEKAWFPALITKHDKSSGGVTVDFDGDSQNLSEDEVKQYLFTTNETLNMNCGDALSLPEISEGSVMYLIKKRYLKDQIYTRVSQIVIGVNPYKRVAYDINVYKACKNDDQLDDAEPHCWCTAKRAYLYCQSEKCSQSIIISGESGAGKTETTKLCLQILSEVAGGSGVETRMMMSSPILELFGNAKTVRNNNSSRFGKWMQIILQNGKITGKCDAIPLSKLFNYIIT